RPCYWLISSPTWLRESLSKNGTGEGSIVQCEFVEQSLETWASPVPEVGGSVRVLPFRPGQVVARKAGDAPRHDVVEVGLEDLVALAGEAVGAGMAHDAEADASHPARARFMLLD